MKFLIVILALAGAALARPQYYSAGFGANLAPSHGLGLGLSPGFGGGHRFRQQTGYQQASGFQASAASFGPAFAATHFHNGFQSSAAFSSVGVAKRR